VEVALEQVAEDFLAKTLEVGAAIARRRASEFLTPADLNVALERLWCGCATLAWPTSVWIIGRLTPFVGANRLHWFQTTT